MLKRKPRQLAALEKRMLLAANYDEWSGAARDHDVISGNERWKQTDHSPLYDHEEIRLRLERLRQLNGRGDHQGLLFTLNQGIHGNMGGMGKPGLYQRARFGTKALIGDYLEEIWQALDRLASPACSDISFDEKIDFFQRASHCYGHSALMLSGAGTLGLFHMGVVKALAENELLPRVISGSSAGAMIAAAVGTHTDDELKHFFRAENIDIKSESKPSLLSWFLAGKDGRMDGPYIEAMHNHFVRDLTFQEAYQLTGHAINISISPAEEHQTSRLLNAITSPNVLVRSAVRASCAVPGAMPPVMLEAKDASGERVAYLPSRRWIDGSVAADLPAKRLSRLYGVNHFIVSQANPLVLWSLSDPKSEDTLMTSAKRFYFGLARESLRHSYKLSKKYLKPFPKLHTMASQVNSIVNQQYTGDINIFPSFRFFDPRKLAKQLNQKELEFLIREGEVCTWPKIEMIRNCVKISKKLEEILGLYDGEANRRNQAVLN
ncbi:DUF3336 domain-containing protein [Pseudomaricurvus alkylphenolicus]|jgi:NTE family protein|uniref:DUF3336 domain-containing protein n=1 Tax=Pseudomaricurvus alkylphenolicus TaxID=1306991 RepID=UPI0014226785|nr:DUF3336 domain-containing protein [Pseudomaricurvus alkylphenolicus]NIB38881.1 DUF3336 domain-containing protein [Pseudomaricurvus alkylphenolicus]